MKTNQVLALITVGLIFFSIIGFFVVKSKEYSTIKSPTDAPTPTHPLGAENQNQGLVLNGQKSNNVNPTAAQNMDVSQLKIEDVKEGTGSAVQAEDIITVNYEGTLLNGTKFDSSFDRHQPLDIQIGVGKVIKGWDQGIIGMKIGGRRILTIPSSLAYGQQGAGGGIIPANAALVFKIELLDIKPSASPSPTPGE